MHASVKLVQLLLYNLHMGYYVPSLDLGSSSKKSLTWNIAKILIQVGIQKNPPKHKHKDLNDDTTKIHI